MKQIRFQPLNNTYQQLNTLLCQLALNIQTTDYTSPTAWARLIEEVQHTCAVFKSHAAKEEAILLPILHNYEPALGAILRDDQCNRMRYINDVCALFTSMQTATNKQKSKLFSHKLLYRLDEFVAATMQQIKEQESMINVVLWRYYSDKELMPMAASFNIALHEKNASFADTIINNLIPSITIKTIPASTQKHNYPKEYPLNGEWAIAV